MIFILQFTLSPPKGTFDFALCDNIEKLLKRPKIKVSSPEQGAGVRNVSKIF
jgi:hypothetical protein